MCYDIKEGDEDMVIGIICEYNPFHNGHIYHLEKIKEKYPDSTIVAVITNYFSMRGDISVLNKYDKTNISLNHGIDLVVEFPYLLATQNADLFAKGALEILNLLNIDILICGSETNDISLIKKISDLEKEEKFQELFKKYYQQGNSYRQSFSLALEDYNITNIKANDMLNLKYYDEIINNDYHFKFELIERIGNDYLDENLPDGKYASATSLRINEDIKDYVPKDVFEIYQNKGFYNLNNFTKILKYNIINNDLNSIFQANEGIENLLKTSFDNIDELIEKISNKRYQKARIKRLISYILVGLKKDFKQNIISYIRPLGFNQKGKDLLNKIKKEILVIGKIKEGINIYLDYEIKLAKLFSIVFDENFIEYEQKLPLIKGESLSAI